jgi:tRNA G18 (ribose-2'-O)-methylase SpoU
MRISAAAQVADVDRTPFRTTPAAERYAHITRLPVMVVLDNVRSLYNTGAFFRTADACAVEKLLLCGITPRPDQGAKQKHAISKTALGADESVAWEYAADTESALETAAATGYHVAAVETSVHAVDLYDWEPAWPVCLVFGHETEGVSPEIERYCQTHVRIPMLGTKHSLNVATAAGVVLYELLRKYRGLDSAYGATRRSVGK